MLQDGADRVSSFLHDCGKIKGGVGMAWGVGMACRERAFMHAGH